MSVLFVSFKKIKPCLILVKVKLTLHLGLPVEPLGVLLHCQHQDTPHPHPQDQSPTGLFQIFTSIFLKMSQELKSSWDIKFSALSFNDTVTKKCSKCGNFFSHSPVQQNCHVFVVEDIKFIHGVFQWGIYLWTIRDTIADLKEKSATLHLFG